MSKIELDEIGRWSETKLAIVREYAEAYSTILAKQSRFRYLYIDGFAGRGLHISRESGKVVHGSPLNALLVKSPFHEYHLVDLDPEKTKVLNSLVKGRSHVHVYAGDCNEILPRDVFPSVKYEDFKRALCLLDPYGLHLRWEVIAAASRMKTVEIFLNFPIMDINRNVLKRDRSAVDPAQAARMSAFWGDDSWSSAAYPKKPSLFGPMEEKERNEVVAEAFRKRLNKVFPHVLAPMPMRNKNGAVLYYLFFAAQRPVAAKIVKDIFDKYRDKGVV